MGVITNPIVLGGMEILERLAYRCADSCIGLSPGIAEGIRKKSSANQTVEMIPNGCDLTLFQPGKRGGLGLAEVSDDDLVAGFTGAHGLANGLDAVVDAAIELKQRGRSDIKLVLIGDGKTKPGLVQRAKEHALSNCVFLDPMPKEQLSALVAKMDVGLMILANVKAFYYGTSPNKFFDYLALGLPVLNNYPGWLADMIKEHQCGIAVKPDDPKSFADALESFADNEEMRRQMGTNARGLGEEAFSRETLADQFCGFLEQTWKRTQ